MESTAIEAWTRKIDVEITEAGSNKQGDQGRFAGESCIVTLWAGTRITGVLRSFDPEQEIIILQLNDMGRLENINFADLRQVLFTSPLSMDTGVQEFGEQWMDMVLAVNDPLDQAIQDSFRFRSGRFVDLVMAAEKDITQAIDRYYDAAGAGTAEIRKQAIEDGMVPLTQNALSLARQKLTSIAEVYRVRL